MAHIPGFGHEHEENVRLRAENELLQTKLATILGSAAYQLSVGLEEEISALASNDGVLLQEVSGDVDAAVENARIAEIRRRAAPLIEKKVAAVLAEETDAIDREAATEADAAAAEAVTRFREQEAEPYRAKVLARLTRARVAGAVLGVKQEIGEEVAAEVASEGDEAIDDRPEQETRAQLKARAAEIRKKTHSSQILPYSMLREKDVITLCFASEGHGNDPYTAPSGGYGWSSTYDSSHEQRKLTVRLLDPALGAFEVVEDSFWKSTTMDHLAVRPGRKILVLSHNPDTEDDLVPILVKANRVNLEALGGKEIGNPRLDLWWVGIGEDEYRVLS